MNKIFCGGFYVDDESMEQVVQDGKKILKAKTNITPESIQEAVDSYLEEHPVSGEDLVAREGVSRLSETVDEMSVQVKSANIFNKNDASIIFGKYVNGSGELVDATNQYVSHPIYCKYGDTINTYQIGVSYYSGCMFDEHGDALGRIGISGNTYTIGKQNVAYIKLNGYSSIIDEAMVSVNEQIPSEYEDYFDYLTLNEKYRLNKKQIAEAKQVADSSSFFDYLGKKHLDITPSAITIIGDRLYAFAYTSAEAPTIGSIYQLNLDGTIGNKIRSFNSNIGHQNTVDYSEGNGYLIATRYSTTDAMTVGDIYLFKNAESLQDFDISSSDCLTIDMLGVLDGDTALNAVWGESDGGEYDLIYVTIRNTAERKRYLYRLQLGKGSHNLGNGTLSSVGDKDFNGTFKVQKRFELEWGGEYGITENTNDMCFSGGALYRGNASANSFSSHKISNYDTSVEINRYSIPSYRSDGSFRDYEPEGITIKNKKLYVALSDHYVYVYSWL